MPWISDNKPFEVASKPAPQPSLKPLPYSESVDGKLRTPVKGLGLKPQFQLFGIDSQETTKNSEIIINNFLNFFIKFMSDILADRSLIEISGKDNKKFLQGLITNDLNKLINNKIIYSAMLNSQGRFLYDFFIFEKKETIFLDCFSPRRDEIIKKLNLYKLRSNVEIVKNDKIKVFFDDKKDDLAEFNFIDPRNEKLGFRIYKNVDGEFFDFSFNSNYHQKRIFLKIPESEHDLTYEKSFILEFGFNELNAVSYDKGCYIGQELTARTHHLGEIRKKIFHVKIDKNIELEKNTKITFDSQNIGVILSGFSNEINFHALALIKILPEQKIKDFANNLEVLGNKIIIIN